MKSYLYILMFSVVLAGCLKENNATLNSEYQVLEPKGKQSQEDKIDKIEVKDIAILQDEALYQFEITDNEKDYKVFLYAENEEQSTQVNETSSNKEDTVTFTGNYSFYIGELDGEKAYKQKVLADVPYTFELNRDGVYTLNTSKKTLIVLPQEMDEEHSRLNLLAVEEGKLHEVKSEDGELINLTGSKIKALNQRFIQTAQHLTSENSWAFSTWVMDGESMSVSLHDQSMVKEDEIGEDGLLTNGWIDIWNEEEEQFFPYHNFEITTEVIERAKLGIPMGSPYPIGTNISEIKKSNPNFIKEGTVNGSQFLMYPETTYYFEAETGSVTAVAIPGERMKTTLNEVITIFGEPEYQKDKNGKLTAIYHADKYTIELDTEENGELNRAFLRRN
ncbi:hypothetical protein [Cytobacillus purgationiresistens]|uniref:Uncharacterized protein n=1 Tax=Cytobacillus purgationiresistens TaxID=863449 RepID=A0ABU0AJV2_9BACI|nr:hypothetical protein [Cytobacillus purgationiresistens]MDQ0271532.1 hypothetical protein [Cytobacillus purgationiresistens]